MKRRSTLRAVEADETSEAPRFPELRLPDAACALCRLREDAPRALATVHGYLRRGLSYTDIARRMEATYDELGLSPFDVDVYDDHLRKHVNATLLVGRLRLAESISSVDVTAAADPEFGSAAVQRAAEALALTDLASPEIARLHEMTDDIVSLRARFLESLEASPELDPYGVIAACALFKEQRAQAESRVKINEAEARVQLAVEGALRMMLEGISEPLGAHMRALARALDNGDLTTARAGLTAAREGLKEVLIAAFNAARGDKQS